MSSKTYKFRWYGETVPLERSAEETHRLLTPLLQDRAINDVITQRLAGVERGGHVLDFGCSFGILSRLIAARGNTVTAIDTSGDAINIARDFAAHKDIEYRCQNFFEAGFAEGEFDGIFFSNTLEHLYSVEPFLREFLRVLKPNGYIICSTPNALSLSDCFSSIAYYRDAESKPMIAFVKKETKNADLDHVSAYTRSTLIRLFDRSGFNVESCRVLGHEPLPLSYGLSFPKAVRKLPFLRGFGDELTLKARRPAWSPRELENNPCTTS